MTRRALPSQFDLVAVVTAGVLTVGTVLLAAPTPLRALFALPLVLFGTGYALACAAFPPGTVSGSDRAILSVAISIAAAILLGVLLNLIAGGITARSWAVGLAALAAAGSVAAAGRRSRSGGRAPALRVHGMRAPRRSQLIAWALVIALFATALALAVRDADRSASRQGVTQLWVNRLSSGAVEVGVGRDGASAQTYRLEIRSAGTVLGSWSRITLSPGRRRTIELAAAPAAGVQAILYLNGSPSPFREATLPGNTTTAKAAHRPADRASLSSRRARHSPARANLSAGRARHSAARARHGARRAHPRVRARGRSR